MPNHREAAQRVTSLSPGCAHAKYRAKFLAKTQKVRHKISPQSNF
jgi:hypothetical protein